MWSGRRESLRMTLWISFGRVRDTDRVPMSGILMVVVMTKFSYRLLRRWWFPAWKNLVPPEWE